MRRLRKFLKSHPEWEGHEDLLVCPPTHQSLRAEFPDGAESSADTEAWTSFGCTRRALYMRLRRTGQTHRFAEMVACQAGPGLMTDSVFFAGLPKLQDQFANDTQREKVLATAQRHGYTPNPNDVYEPGLARFQGDPEAFVPPTGGRGYIRRLCERRGWGCNGAVEVQHSEPIRDPMEQSIPLAESIVKRRMREAIQKDPSSGRNKKKLRESIIAKHGGVGHGT